MRKITTAVISRIIQKKNQRKWKESHSSRVCFFFLFLGQPLRSLERVIGRQKWKEGVVLVHHWWYFFSYGQPLRRSERVICRKEWRKGVVLAHHCWKIISFIKMRHLRQVNDIEYRFENVKSIDSLALHSLVVEKCRNGLSLFVVYWGDLE